MLAKKLPKIYLKVHSHATMWRLGLQDDQSKKQNKTNLYYRRSPGLSPGKKSPRFDRSYKDELYGNEVRKNSARKSPHEMEVFGMIVPPSNLNYEDKDGTSSRLSTPDSLTGKQNHSGTESSKEERYCKMKEIRDRVKKVS